MGQIPTKPVAETLTEKNVLDQTGKVFLVTGATSGIGQELARILFAANAKVWITARSKSKGESTIAATRQAFPNSKGSLSLLLIDFNDLTTIKPAAEKFLQTEQKLDILWNNAGIMIPPKGQKTAQGYEAQLGVNVVGPFLFTSLLESALLNSAAQAPRGRTRVVWVSSSAAKAFSPTGGVDMSKLTAHNTGDDMSQWQHYGMSKAAAILLAAEYVRQYGDRGITSVAVDPGNLDTGLYTNMPKWQHLIARKIALKPAIYGAYTELFAGLSETILVEESNGAWVIPWGAVSIPREDIDVARKEEGPSGRPGKLWEWCEKEVAAFR